LQLTDCSRPATKGWATGQLPFVVVRYNTKLNILLPPENISWIAENESETLTSSKIQPLEEFELGVYCNVFIILFFTQGCLTCDQIVISSFGAAQTGDSKSAALQSSSPVSKH